MIHFVLFFFFNGLLLFAIFIGFIRMYDDGIVIYLCLMVYWVYAQNQIQKKEEEGERYPIRELGVIVSLVTKFSTDLPHEWEQLLLQDAGISRSQRCTTTLASPVSS